MSNDFNYRNDWLNIYIFENPVQYKVYYGDIYIALLETCIELDDEVLNLFIENICRVYDPE